jgi:TatD DNase family protein
MNRAETPAPRPLAAPVADSHCHLDIAAGDRGGAHLPVDEAVARATAVGVPRIVQIGCDLTGAAWAVSAAEEHPALVAGVALHPNEIPGLAAAGRLDEALAEIDRLAGSSARVRAIGETGLDHYRTAEPDWKVQEDGFRAHIALARKHDKVLVIHDREAHEDILRVLAEEPAPPAVVMHCFSGDAEMARECVRRGYYLSFAGTVTFKNAGGLRAALAAVPPGQLLVETDAPYLTPAPYRGRTNASYLIPLTVRCMVEVTGVDEETLCTAIDAATTEAFGHW